MMMFTYMSNPLNQNPALDGSFCNLNNKLLGELCH